MRDDGLQLQQLLLAVFRVFVAELYIESLMRYLSCPGSEHPAHYTVQFPSWEQIRAGCWKPFSL